MSNGVSVFILFFSGVTKILQVTCNFQVSNAVERERQAHQYGYIFYCFKNLHMFFRCSWECLQPTRICVFMTKHPAYMYIPLLNKHACILGTDAFYSILRQPKKRTVPPTSQRNLCSNGCSLRGSHGIFNSPVHSQRLREGTVGE